MFARMESRDSTGGPDMLGRVDDMETGGDGPQNSHHDGLQGPAHNRAAPMQEPGIDAGPITSRWRQWRS